MTVTFENVDDLARQHPEWAPWLAVVGIALGEIGQPAWETAVLRRGSVGHSEAPVLAKCTLRLESDAVRRFLDKLLRSAAEHGTPAMAPLLAFADEEYDAVAVIEAAVNRDDNRLAQYAARARRARTLSRRRSTRLRAVIARL